MVSVIFMTLSVRGRQAARLCCLLALEMWAGIGPGERKVRAQSFPSELVSAGEKFASRRPKRSVSVAKPRPCVNRAAGHNRKPEGNQEQGPGRSVARPLTSSAAGASAVIGRRRACAANAGDNAAPNGDRLT